MPEAIIPSNGLGLDKLVDCHEARLSRLEELATNTVEQLATNTIQIVNLTDKLDLGLTQITQTIFENSEKLSIQLRGTNDFNKMAESRLSLIESQHLEEKFVANQKAKKFKAWRTALWAVFWAVIGVGVKEVVPYLVK